MRCTSCFYIVLYLLCIFRNSVQGMKWDEERFGLEYDLDIYMIVAVDFFNMLWPPEWYKPGSSAASYAPATGR